MPKNTVKSTFNSAEKPGNEELFTAVIDEDTARVAALLDDGADPNVTQNGIAPLLTAAARGCVEIVALLLNHGAEINAQSRSGYSALMSATYDNHVEVVRLLIDRGAAIEAANRPDCHTPLIFAAMQGHVEVLRLLIEEMADPDKKDAAGHRALYYAEHYEHHEAAQLLREAPALQKKIRSERAETKRLADMHERATGNQALLQQQARARRLKPRGP